MAPIYFTQIRVECTHPSDLLGKNLHVEIRTAGGLSMPKCGSAEKGCTQCERCLGYLMRLFTQGYEYQPNTVIKIDSRDP